MAIIDILLIVFALLTIILFIKANTKTYSPLRRKEARRYFNGSFVNKEESYKERSYTYGLAFVKNDKGEFRFKKQAKMTDTALFY